MSIKKSGGSNKSPTEPDQRTPVTDTAKKGSKINPEASKYQDGEEALSPAGPHAKPSKTNTEATPGAGALPPTKPAREVEPGTG